MARPRLPPKDPKVARKELRERRQRSIPLYFSTLEEKEKFQKLAEKDGFRVFSKWALVKLREISTGEVHSHEYVEQLRKERSQYEKWYQTEKEKVAKLEREKEDLNRRMQVLAEKVATLAEKIK